MIVEVNHDQLYDRITMIVEVNHDQLYDKNLNDR